LRPARFLLPAGVALSLAAAGCGSDSSGETTAPPVSIPAVTAPQISTATPAPATTPKTGGTAPGKGGRNYDPNQPDSPTNDVPPPAGSPQEAFEKQCEQNPAACG
jgi:hypothetical protein